MTARRALRRVHVWLGWLVGVPLLFWTVSGLWMVARPIEEVRGTALRVVQEPLELPGRLALPASDRPIRLLAVEMQRGRPVWLVTRADGTAARADATTGAALPDPDAAEARAIATAAYAPRSAVVSVTRTPADRPPIDLRRPRPAWRVAFADRTHVYVDAETGAVLALRTAQWRTFDWMWGLHIMDLGEREDTSHATLILFAALAVATVLLALALLPLAIRRRRGRKTL